MATIFLARLVDHEKHENIQMEVDSVRCSWMYKYCGLKKGK